MNIKRRTVKRAVTLLSNANPTFVSIVGHGANQTPFKVIKVADLTQVPANIENAMSKTATASTSTGAEQTAKDGATQDIHKISFSGEKFPTETAVKEFLDADGYENYTVSKVEDGNKFSWVVKGVDEEHFESIAPVAKADGVMLFVGTLKNAANTAKVTEDATTETTQKTGDMGDKGKGKAKKEGEEAASNDDATTDASTTQKDSGNGAVLLEVDGEKVTKQEKVTKYSEYSYADYYSKQTGSTTIAGVLEDFNDGLPVGFDDIMSAFRKALRNTIIKGETDNIVSITSELGTVLTTLSTLTGTVKKADGETDLTEGVAKLLGEDVPASPETTEHKGDEQNQVAKSDDAVALAIAQHLQPLVDKMAAIETNMVKKSDLAPMQEQVKKTSSEIVEIQRQRITRKAENGADASASTASTVQKKAEEAQPQSRVCKVDRSTASSFGIRNTARSLSR